MSCSLKFLDTKKNDVTIRNAFLQEVSLICTKNNWLFPTTCNNKNAGDKNEGQVVEGPFRIDMEGRSCCLFSSQLFIYLFHHYIITISVSARLFSAYFAHLNVLITCYREPKCYQEQFIEDYWPKANISHQKQLNC